MAYPIVNGDAEMLKIKTNDDQLKELQFKTEKQDPENILKSLKADNEKSKKKYKSLNRNKVLFFIT